jgi:MOSC domain-containing protein YiiM
MLQIRQLLISPGHNFFGHHGKAPGEHPMLEVPEVECVAGKGIVGDRFYDHKSDYKGQITFFAWEVYEELRRALGGTAGISALRRNVITLGVDLNTLIGTEFEIQGVRFAGTQECAPCYWMEQAFAPGAEEFLRGRGGLRARILQGGTLRVL